LCRRIELGEEILFETIMKYADIEKIREAGLITADQQRQILEHFKLKEESNKALAVFSFIGAALVVCGVILLIGAHWNEIPRGLKIAAGLLLMLGAHAGGWYLREVQGVYRKSGEALHLAGSGLFLANIALIGQIYNISTRTPNAFLLWWVGIAALPWLLRSKAQHILTLLAFGLWFGLEINERGSLVFFGSDEYQILLYALLGLAWVGAGYCLRRTSFADFAPPTEKLGLLAFQAFTYPLTWRVFYREPVGAAAVSPWVFPALGALALLLVVAGVPRLTGLTRQWRWTWGLTLAGGIGLLAGQLYLAPRWTVGFGEQDAGYHWFCSLALFVFCLLQIQVGVQQRSSAMVNLGVAFIALDITSVYINLFGSMARTGLMFVVSGLFLIGFGIFLEKRRRALLQQIKAPAQ
jgi:uncharacterized membrane protein